MIVSSSVASVVALHWCSPRVDVGQAIFTALPLTVTIIMPLVSPSTVGSVVLRFGEVRDFALADLLDLPGKADEA